MFFEIFDTLSFSVSSSLTHKQISVMLWMHKLKIVHAEKLATHTHNNIHTTSETHKNSPTHAHAHTYTHIYT